MSESRVSRRQATRLLLAGSALAWLPEPATGTTGARRAEAAAWPDKADFIQVEKRWRRMQLFANGAPLRTYTIALGRNPVGHKRFEGDGRTPEGRYHIDWRNPNSDYFLSLRISYPNTEDLAYAQANGRSPGGLIMIHGQPNDPAFRKEIEGMIDWTDGCIAVTNDEMMEVWAMVDEGTPIEILP